MKQQTPFTPARKPVRVPTTPRIWLIVCLALLFIALGWITIFRMSGMLTNAVIDVYQQTEMETVRSVARSIDYYVNEHIKDAKTGSVDLNAMEQELFKLFVDPVLLLQSGDAWIYAPDHVVFDQSSDFPDAYRGKSMAEIFAIQKLQGASHYEEMTEAVMNARAGVGWYVWLPSKGREITAWTPVRVGSYVWTIGLSTPLPEILRSTGVDAELRAMITQIALGTLIAMVLLAVWIAAEIRRRKAEDSLYGSEQRFRSVVDTAAAAIVAVDASGRIVFWSRGAEAIFGRGVNEALGMELEALFTPHAGEVGKAAPIVDSAIVGREGIRADGSRFPAECASARWSASNGEFTTYIVQDRSEQEEAERKRTELEQKLQRAQRMESLGVLAGGVAHDLNNLLAPIVGYTDLLIEEAEKGSETREMLVMLRSVSERAGAVVQDLLTLGRRGSYQMSTADMNEAVTDFIRSPSVADARMRFPRVVVESDIAATPLPVSCSLPHLFKAFLNLTLNACEAMPAGGMLTLGTSLRRLDERRVGYETIPPGTYAVFGVRDTGVGIEAKDLERIFEPFYTKKKMGRSGTGLGLAVVYGVVHDHQGWVDVQTAPGKGSTIELWFPLSAAALPVEPRKPFELRGTETVMLVEDQPEQRTVTRKLLERAGYAVVTAENGRAAIAELKKKVVDLMILDMIMEESYDGLDCYRDAVAVRPGQKAIIVSGFAETVRVAEAQRLGAGRFIRKPYRMDTLLQAIREELAGAED